MISECMSPVSYRLKRLDETISVRCNNRQEYDTLMYIANNSNYTWMCGERPLNNAIHFSWPVWIIFKHESRQLAWTLYPISYVHIANFLVEYCEVEK